MTLLALRPLRFGFFEPFAASREPLGDPWCPSYLCGESCAGAQCPTVDFGHDFRTPLRPSAPPQLIPVGFSRRPLSIRLGGVYRDWVAKEPASAGLLEGLQRGKLPTMLLQKSLCVLILNTCTLFKQKIP